MSNPDTTLGPEEDEPVQQPDPSATWGSKEDKQVQQPDPASVGAQQTSSTTNPPVDQQTTRPVYTVPDYPPHSESEIALLRESYEAVRLGNVKDPDTIRMVAARFEQHVYDPTLDFYPMRAAEILYSRARFYEEQNYLKRRFPDVPNSSVPIEAYPPMEDLPLKPIPPQYPVQPPPSELQPAEPLEGAESPIIGREEALAWIFVIRKLNSYLLWFLMVLEITLLIEFSLTLIGANQNNLFVGFINFLTFIPLYPFNGIVPSTKLEPSGLVIEWSTLIAMFVYFLAFLVLRIFLHILISSPEESYEDFDLKPPKASDDRAFASNFAIRQVRSFYKNVHRQFKSWWFFSVFAIILGTLCIVSVYLIPYLGRFFPISESTTTVITILIAAGALYSIAIVSFLQNRKASKQVDSYYFNKLIEAEKISQLVTLASRTPVSESQERINEKIITQILLPLGVVPDSTEKTVQGRGVPNLQKLDLFEAAERAHSLGMKVVPVGQDSSYPNIAPGLIVSQNPMPGTMVETTDANREPEIHVILSKRL